LSFTSQLQNELKDYIQCEDLAEKERIKKRLSAELPNPLFISNCDFIPNEHILKKEAWIVSDAFEAVTNGMFSSELFEQLKTIPEGSLLSPWAVLTQAVEAFYAGSFQAVETFSNSIPEGSAPYSFVSFFNSVIANETLPEEWQRLGSSILDNKEELKSSLEQLNDASTAGMGDILLETATMIIRDISRKHPDTAQKILIWCFDQLQEIDILPDKAAHVAHALFGEVEGSRLTALSTLSYDQDRSLVYWLLTLQAYLKDNSTDKSDVKAFLSIIRDVAETVALEFELTDEYLSLLMTHSISLIASLRHLYPDMVEAITEEEVSKPSTIIKILQKLAGEKEKYQAPSHKKPIQQNSAPVQFELF